MACWCGQSSFKRQIGWVRSPPGPPIMRRRARSRQSRSLEHLARPPMPQILPGGGLGLSSRCRRDRNPSGAPVTGCREAAIPPALGAGKRRFDSCHPDHITLASGPGAWLPKPRRGSSTLPEGAMGDECAGRTAGLHPARQGSTPWLPTNCRVASGEAPSPSNWRRRGQHPHAAPAHPRRWYSGIWSTKPECGGSIPLGGSTWAARWAVQTTSNRQTRGSIPRRLARWSRQWMHQTLRRSGLPVRIRAGSPECATTQTAKRPASKAGGVSVQVRGRAPSLGRMQSRARAPAS